MKRLLGLVGFSLSVLLFIETAPAGADSEHLGLAEAIEIAIDAENSAILYYDALATTSTGEASAFFERMGKEEEAHAEAIRALLDKAGAD
jgi:rubrerythrin